VVVAGTVALGACGGSSDDSSSTGTSFADSAAFAPATTRAAVAGSAADATGRVQTGAATATTASSGGTATPSPSVAPPVVNRDVVYTATIAVRVGDVAAATANAQRQAESLGGALFNQSSSLIGNEARSVLVFKVAPAAFTPLLDALAGLGDEQDRTVKADDVTAAVVDLEARLKSANASLDRTRTLLAAAKDIGEIMAIESQLTQRESAVEQLQGQLRVLQSQVALSTITATLTGTPPLSATEIGRSTKIVGPGAGEGWRGSVHALRVAGKVAAFVLVVAVPWLPAALLVALVVWLVSRRRRRALFVSSLASTVPVAEAGDSGWQQGRPTVQVGARGGLPDEDIVSGHDPAP
jgi:hypothetical protein